MSVVDLTQRKTGDWNEFNQFSSSSNSPVYVSIDSVIDGPSSMNLTVGDKWYDLDRRKEFKIGEKGCKLSSRKSILIETAQLIAVPLNVFGIVVGSGKNIYRGAFVSPGKINPGFSGKLKIGVFNGCRGTWVFKRGDLLGSCVFYNIETSIESPLETYQSNPEPELKDQTVWYRALDWGKRNWPWLITTIVAIIALMV